MMSRMKIVSGSVKSEEFVPREKADITFVRNESIVDIPQNIGKITPSFSLSSSTLVYPVTSTNVTTDAHELLPHSQNPEKASENLEETLHANVAPVVKVPNVTIPDTPCNIITGLVTPFDVEVMEDENFIVSEFEKISIFSRDGKRLKSLANECLNIKEARMVAITPNGQIIASDFTGYKIVQFTVDGKGVMCIGKEGKQPLQFSFPNGITVCSSTGRIFICDGNNYRIQVLNPDLSFSYMFDVQFPSTTSFYHSDLTLDKNGFIYVADTGKNRILKLTIKGEFITTFGSKGSSPGQLSKPSGITVDDNGLLYVTETGNHRISIFTNDGEFVRCFGEKGNNENQFNEPKGIVYRHGHLYVCDKLNHRLKIY